MLAGWSLAAGPTLFACLGSSGPPACNALANCCLNGGGDDPSSCAETAQSGETDAMCGAALAIFVAQGVCTEDGGPPPSVDASHQ
jgi:hypothetical protein